MVYGVGVNDSPTPVQKNKKVNGKTVCVWRCTVYNRWIMMLQRCYSESYQRRKPTYKGCTVCDEWLYFSNFKSWMEQQDWEGKELDKDILFKGNKVYSPDTCIFVHGTVNIFIKDNKNNRGMYPIGVTWNKSRGVFVSRVNNPITGIPEYLGSFNNPVDAHNLWKARKRELVLLLVGEGYITDTRIVESLLDRYKNQDIGGDNSVTI